MSFFNGKYVSVQNIIGNVYRNMGMADNINLSDAVEWAGEALELIGAVTFLENKVVDIPVSEYKAAIPCELHFIETAAAYVLADDTEHPDCSNEFHFIPMRYSTDAYHHRYCKGSSDYTCVSDLTYVVNDHYIKTNFKTGFVRLAMVAMPVDEQGFPKIPDDIKFRQAVTHYIMYKLAFIKTLSGKMPGGLLEKIEQQKDFYMGAASTRAVMPSVDMMESIKNNWLRLIPKINQHASGFKSVGDRERRIIHNANVNFRDAGISKFSKED